MKTSKIEIRVSPKQKTTIKQEADKIGLSLSSYVLSRILKAIGNEV